MDRRTAWLAFAGTLLLVAPGSATALHIQMERSHFTSSVAWSAGNAATDSDSVTLTVPWSWSTSAKGVLLNSGTASQTATGSVSGGSGAIAATYQAEVPSPELAAGNRGDVFFRVDRDVAYDVGGVWSWEPRIANFVNAPTHANLWVRLLDGTTGSVLFASVQEEVGTWSGTLVSGGSGGNHRNEILGSSTGRLQAGHVYEFEWRAGIAPDPLHRGFRGSGSAELSLIALPEPGVGAFLATALASCAAARRRPAPRGSGVHHLGARHELVRLVHHDAAPRFAQRAAQAVEEDVVDVAGARVVVAQLAAHGELLVSA